MTRTPSQGAFVEETERGRVHFTHLSFLLSSLFIKAPQSLSPSLGERKGPLRKENDTQILLANIRKILNHGKQKLPAGLEAESRVDVGAGM